MNKFSKKIVALFFGILLSAPLSAPISAQTAPTPTPAMIEQFKQLPREQQVQLAAQYGIDLSQIDGSNQGAAKPTEVEQLVPTERAIVSAAAQTDKADKDEQFERFGLKMFDASISTFAPVNNMPVPDDYVLGADDSVQVQLYGKETSSQVLVIDREGKVQLDGVGPLQLAGLKFGDATGLIKTKIAEAKIGVEAAVSMGKLRTINIFIAGEAKFPGMYAVSAMTTVTQALFVSGGVTDIGSLREIKINRAGKTIGTFDLYDLLLKGDNSSDINLRHGDVLFVSPVKAQLAVTGLVNRPAIYELKANETIGDALRMAGGAKANAHLASVTLERINAKRVKDLQTLDLTNTSVLKQAIKDGDVLSVKPISNRIENEVVLHGAVVRPGRYAYSPNMTLTSLLSNVWADLQKDTNLDYALVVRETSIKGDIKVIQLNLGEELGITNGGLPKRFVLQPRDQILIFDHSAEQRKELLQPVLAKLKQQATKEQPQQVVSIQGQVKIPGQYPIAEGSRLTDVLLAAGGLTDSAFVETVDMDYALLVREIDSRANVAVTQFSLAEQLGLSGESSTEQALLVQPQDQILIFDFKADNRRELLNPLLTRLKRQSSVDDTLATTIITGQVKYPGEYPLTAGLTVTNLIKAAGGMTDAAFKQRVELSRLVGFNEENSNYDVQNTSIDLASILNNTQPDVVLQSRDRLNVFAKPEWAEERTVTIGGEVRFPGTYQVTRGEKLSELIARAGGFTEDAFPFGAIFTRQKVKEIEQEQFNRLLQQLKADIASKAVSGGSNQGATAIGQAPNPEQTMGLVKQLESTEMIGRLAINMVQIEAGNPEYDIVLEQGDRLLVPRKTRSVTVIGEVQFPSSHYYNSELDVADYLALAGNPRKRADKDRVYVIRADGSVLMPNQGLFSSNNAEIVPGDTIVVPLDVEYKDSLSLWGQVTQIAYQAAISVAAVKSL